MPSIVPAPTSGYSATPLARKLSLKHGMRCWWDDMPASVRREIALEDIELNLLDRPEPPIEAAHIFVTRQSEMVTRLVTLRPLLTPTGFIWVSWPKKASRVPTDLDEGRIRDWAVSKSDLVDVKVCAVDAIWSGLKLMIRRACR